MNRMTECNCPEAPNMSCRWSGSSHDSPAVRIPNKVASSGIVRIALRACSLVPLFPASVSLIWRRQARLFAFHSLHSTEQCIEPQQVGSVRAALDPKRTLGRTPRMSALQRSHLLHILVARIAGAFVMRFRVNFANLLRCPRSLVVDGDDHLALVKYHAFDLVVKLAKGN